MTDISEMLKLQDDELLSKGEAFFSSLHPKL